MDIVERLRKGGIRSFALNREAADEIERLWGILSEFIEVNNDPCRLDHHGYCQAHFLEEDCMVRRARKMLGK